VGAGLCAVDDVAQLGDAAGVGCRVEPAPERSFGALILCNARLNRRAPYRFIAIPSLYRAAAIVGIVARGGAKMAAIGRYG
jgi:hypothetical protein